MSHTETNTTIYVIGANTNGELGFGHKHEINKLTQLSISNENITNIYCGDGYMIYISNTNNLYCCGKNQKGQLGIRAKLSSTNKLKQLTYFHNKNIQISQIFTSVSGSSTFWKCNNFTIFANGNAKDNCLGSGINHQTETLEPILIHGLENVMDISIANKYSIALCGISHYHLCIVLTHWYTNRLIPDDIILVIEQFYILYGDIGTVYSTPYSWFGGNGHGIKRGNAFSDNKWHTINCLRHIEIIKIKTGYVHSLFLAANGEIWSCGANENGQCGLGIHLGETSVPIIIEYFVNNKIKIKDIVCGESHCLAIDEDYDLWSWGYNKYGQCGHKVNEYDLNIYTPLCVDVFSSKRIIHIDCGHQHSLAVTCIGDYYLFGDNEYNQCLRENVNDIPVLVNEIVANEFVHMFIKRVICGAYETILFLQNK
eukprot:488257_1